MTVSELLRKAPGVRIAVPDLTQPSRAVVLLLAGACGVAVGTIYFPQAVTPLIAASWRLSPDAAGRTVTATQVGYAVGIFLIVPLGDRHSPRPMIAVLFSVCALALLAGATASSPGVLVAASALVGITTVAGQVIATMTGRRVDPARRAEVLGMLLSGSIAGMLVARAFAGMLGGWLGWRAPYLLDAGVMLALTPVVVVVLPSDAPRPTGSCSRRLLGEPLRLLATQRELRRSCVYQTAIFAGFSAVWTSVAFLITGPPYRLGTGAVGLLALVGAVTMLCAPRVGRRVDERGPDRVNLGSMLGVLAAAAVLLLAGLGHGAGLASLVLGLVVLDVAMQSGMVANTARVYAIDPEASGSLGSAYMACAYLAGGLGSVLGTAAFRALAWPGVCALLAVLAAVALTRHLYPSRAGLEVDGDARSQAAGSAPCSS
jgi:predicted MFS family arabinose efflux permease